MTDFLHYGIKKKPIARVFVKPANKIVEKKEEKKEEEMEAQVVMAESTAPVMEKEKIVITEQDTVQEVVEKVKKSKKLHAKVSEDGKKIRIKRILKD